MSEKRFKNKKEAKFKVTPTKLISAVILFQLICLLRLAFCETTWEKPIAFIGLGVFMAFEIIYCYLIKRFMGGGGVLEISAFFLSGVDCLRLRELRLRQFYGNCLHFL